MENKNYIKKFRFFISLRKEKMWLEEMAAQGYLFQNISFGGIRYTFEIGMPKKMVYEIDRFNVPKNPTLSQIHEKEEFLSLATELGWQEVTHDIDMNYYFSKEYVEGDINELYNDNEMRMVHANKYYDHMMELPNTLNTLSLVLSVLVLVEYALASNRSIGFIVFALGYSMFTLAYQLITKHFALYYRKELSLSSEEWYDTEQERQTYKHKRRFFLSSKQLGQYLMAQSQRGWHIQKMGIFHYVFKQGEPETRYYMIDSSSTVNRRRKKEHLPVIDDARDISNQNNDWQQQSAKDASTHGWDFVCASGNTLILYKKDTPPDESDILSTNSLYLHPWLAYWGIAGIIGFIAGFIASIVF